MPCGYSNLIQCQLFDNISSVCGRPNINKFHAISMYFYGVISMNENPMSFRRTFFNVMLMDEELMFFWRFFFDVIWIDKKWTPFWCVLCDVISMDKKSRLFWYVFFMQFWLMKNRCKFDVPFPCIFERENILFTLISLFDKFVTNLFIHLLVEIGPVLCASFGLLMARLCSFGSCACNAVQIPLI